MSPELELSAAYPIDQRVRYDVSSHPAYSLQADAELAGAERWLALPAGFNPRALAAGAALRAPAPIRSSASTRCCAASAPTAFRTRSSRRCWGATRSTNSCTRPRAGFCEHYASAFVFLMRAAGVPARVVTGYQGGEVNPVDGFLTVRQSDAHAWAEVWLAGRGWLRVDPTAAVAPERVQRSLARARPRKNPFGIEALGQLMNFDGDRDSLLAQLRFELGALNNGWNQWVLNYTPERQHGVIEAIKAGLLNWRTLAALAVGALLLALARTRRERRRGDPVDALYSALCLQLGRLGLARGADEGPNAYRAAARRRALAAAPEERRRPIPAPLQRLQIRRPAARPAAGRHPEKSADKIPMTFFAAPDSPPFFPAACWRWPAPPLPPPTPRTPKPKAKPSRQSRKAQAKRRQGGQAEAGRCARSITPASRSTSANGRRSPISRTRWSASTASSATS